MLDPLLYRRQFLLARNPIHELEDWPTEHVGPYVLHVHPDLQLTTVSQCDRKIVLLGYFFDPSRPESSNLDILQRVLSESKHFGSLVAALKAFPGRYALFWQQGPQVNLMQDALALREVYYLQQDNLVVCGSQPSLLKRFAAPPIRESTECGVKDFVQYHLPQVRNGRLWPGDGTRYEAVKHLLPNHYLEIPKLQTRRYWPNIQLKRIGFGEAITRCTAFLRGAMKAAAHRHSLMLAVTAGLDSRALLAASREIAGSTYFFINQHSRLGERSGDIRIPRQIFQQIGLPFHIHRVKTEVPEDFRAIFHENTEFAHDALLPVIYNVYFKQHPEKCNILGVGEVGRTKFFNEPRVLSPYYLAYMLRYRKSTYAVQECERWLDQAKPIARQFELNVMTLFWWEVLIGNWGAVGNSESDISIEEFDPYCSHYLYETFLSIDSQYRTFRDNALFKELIRTMWPELLAVPFNPPEGLADLRDMALHRLGLEEVARRLKFKLNEFCYRAWWEPLDRKRIIRGSRL